MRTAVEYTGPEKLGRVRERARERERERERENLNVFCVEIKPVI